MSDVVTHEFNRRCRDGDTGLLDAMEAAAPHLPPGFRKFWEKSLLARPLFVPSEEITGFAAQVRSLFDLLTALPQRVYDGDVDLYCAAAGIDRERARHVRRFADRAPTLFGRADIYRVERSFKLLEFNVCSAVGGLDRFLILEALLRTPAFRAFAEEHRLTYTNTGRLLAEALRAAAATVTADAPGIALVAPDGGLPTHSPYLATYAEMLGSFGLDTVTGEIGAVTERGGRLFLHGRRVDVVMRFLSDTEMATAKGHGARAVLRAHEEGRAVLWTGLENQRVNNKGALALLADDSVRTTLTHEEAALVDRVLPWTRRLARTRTRVGSETVDLLEHCRDHRERLLVKPSFGEGGSGLVAGWQTDDAAWAELLEEGVKQAWTVQERVVPEPEPVVDPGSRVERQWASVWGAFFTPAGYAGLHIRAVPEDSDDPVIRAEAAGARMTGAFHYPGTPER